VGHFVSVEATGPWEEIGRLAGAVFRVAGHIWRDRIERGLSSMDVSSSKLFQSFGDTKLSILFILAHTVAKGPIFSNAPTEMRFQTIYQR
jgi:hypothetical protein